MKRRAFGKVGLGWMLATPWVTAMSNESFSEAATILQRSIESGLVDAATLYVEHRGRVFSWAFGKANSTDAVFLLASITKPMAIAAVMSLAEHDLFRLDDPVRKYLPEFTGDGRESITLRHLMTHVSGLPDQLPENAQLRAAHAGLDQFVKAAIRTPLLFEPGTKYSYSSMAILLASEVAQRLSGKSIAELVDQSVFSPLQMKHSALGVGRLDFDSLMRCQVESAAPESGAGDPSTKSWDWNSRYWRYLGSPWGGAHGSAPDVARFLRAFLHPVDGFLKTETIREMIRNHNGHGVRPRGLGFDLGKKMGGPNVSDQTFGHGGSTGTLCWADPVTETILVVLTTLPSTAVSPHPRDVAARAVARTVEPS
jgi:CubicO group peptidase (beta-lactamase class C family)